jgi:hypothetical protein
VAATDAVAAGRAVLLGAVLLMVAVGCTSGAHGGVPPGSTPVGVAPVDPLVDLASSEYADLIDGVRPSLHRRGDGPGRYTIGRSAGVREQRFFVSCAPEAPFTVTLGTFYSGTCTSHFTSSGSIPVPAGDGPLSVEVDVAAGVHYWLVAIPVGP